MGRPPPSGSPQVPRPGLSNDRACCKGPPSPVHSQTWWSGALIRFLQATKGVGFAHYDGSREFVLGYADDPCLVANTTAEMQVLLRQVELFCARTGLELNVAKTVVQGIDYATGADLRRQKKRVFLR